MANGDSNFNLPDFLKGFGIPTESLDHIRLGRGAVGRVTTVALGVLSVLGVTAWKAESEWLRIGAGVAAVAIFIIFIFKVLSFAEKNPGLSLLTARTL